MPLFSSFWLLLLVATGFAGAVLATRRRLHPLLGFVAGAFANVGAYVFLLDPPFHRRPARPQPDALHRVVRALYLAAGAGLFAYAALQTLVLSRLALAGATSGTIHLHDAAAAAFQLYQAPGALALTAAWTGAGCAVVLWGLSFYLVIRDPVIPNRYRAPWIAALLLGNVFAALAFVPWWRTLSPLAAPAA